METGAYRDWETKAPKYLIPKAKNVSHQCTSTGKNGEISKERGMFPSLDEGGKKVLAERERGKCMERIFFESLDADLAQGRRGKRRRRGRRKSKQKECIIKGNKEQRGKA